MSKPEQLKFADTHEWVDWSESNGSAVATVGISAFAIEQLNDLVFMSLPGVGQRFKAGEEFGEVESVKAVSPLYSPIGGEVIEINRNLPNQLETLINDPYLGGWLIKLRPDDPQDLDRLLNFDAYRKQCAEGGH